MKSTIVWKLALIIALVLPLNSCTNLDEKIFSQLTDEVFPQNQEQFIAALGAAYTNLYGVGSHNGMMSLQEVASDEIMIPQRGTDWFDGGQWLRVHRHEYNPNEEAINNAWNFLYGGVANCNRLISLFEGLVADGKVSAEQADAFIAELKVLRSLFYYWAMDIWGNIPIETRFADADPTPATRNRSEVFAFIESELKTNVPKLSKNKDGSTYARFNYYAGQALLAKLYLNAQVYTGTAKWDDCLAACDEIINSGLYNLEGDYFANFNTDNGASKENILVVPYDRVFARGFNLPQMTLHYQSQASFDLQQQPWNGYCTLQEFYNSYDNADKRKGELGNQQTRGNFHAGPQFASDGRTRLQDSGAEPSDPDGANLTFTPEVNAHFPNCLRQAGARVGKFQYKVGATPDLDNDFPIFRYSDILMAKAEALYRKNGGSTASATDLFNLIRTRAGLPEFTSLTEADMLAERGREMFYEGIRRQDLIRFGKYNDARTFKPASDPSKNIFPIPGPQIAANPNLRQNPGY